MGPLHWTALLAGMLAYMIGLAHASILHDWKRRKEREETERAAETADREARLALPAPAKARNRGAERFRRMQARLLSAGIRGLRGRV